MRIDYYVVNPTGNITILVKTPIDEELQPHIAEALLSIEKCCEQVGFIEALPYGSEYEMNLRMAGGEFCGNATMSAAAIHCFMQNMVVGKVAKVTLRVSGASSLVKVVVKRAEMSRFIGRVSMPTPVDIKDIELEYAGRKYCYPLVSFEGISHIIIKSEQADIFSKNKSLAEQAIKAWCKELGVASLGLMFFDEKESLLRPLVYVSAIDSLFWESSCASGTAALGASLAFDNGHSICLDVNEPGGQLRVEADPAGVIKLSGEAVIERMESINLD